MTALSAITNFVQLTADIGTSGQPKRDQFAQIAEAGYQTVINLALPSSDHAIPDEGSVVTDLGMRYVHIPVKFDEPTSSDLQAFIGVMNALQGSQVWVHCVVNARVSAFLFLYLHHVCRLPASQARSPVLDRWEPKMDAVWRQFLATPAEQCVPLSNMH
ncbi:MAG: protein tyrosine phosphatase family protein [Pseudomonadales bacterium]